MPFIMNQAGGVATIDAPNALEVQPVALHDRVPIVMGGAQDVALYERFWGDSDQPPVNLASDGPWEA